MIKNEEIKFDKEKVVIQTMNDKLKVVIKSIN